MGETVEQHEENQGHFERDSWPQNLPRSTPTLNLGTQEP